MLRYVPFRLALIVISLAGVANASLAECREPSAAKKQDVSAYVLKKYQLPSSADLLLKTSAKANDGCFWKFEYQTASAKRNIVLYLSPDGAYLLPTLYDMSVDPLAELRAEQDKTMKALLVGSPAAQGPATAPVTIVEFSDFECPFCRRLTEALEKEVLPKERERVNLVFRNFPLPMHPWAKKAAEMAVCAGLQKPEAFWGVHDFLFQNQQTLRPDTLQEQVMQYVETDKSIDLTQFQTCVNKELALGPVTQDQQLGLAVSIHGTPTMFVNGVRFDGVRSAAELETIINQAARGELVGPAEKMDTPVNVARSAATTAGNQCVRSVPGGAANAQ